MKRSDTGPNPGLPTEYSYFFDTTFRNSVFGFAGEIGNIYGFYLSSYMCIHEDSIPDDHICEEGSGFWSDFWMTLVTDENDTPIAVNFMPDDDNHGGIKGNSQEMTVNFIEANSDDTINIKNGINGVVSGGIFNFPKDFTDIPIGGTVSGVYFEGLDNAYGVISVLRRQL
jgi:hypothetical protein